MHPEERPKQDKYDTYKPFIWLVILIIVIQCVVGFALSSWMDSWETRGQFGDMFGVLNSLFSGLALAGVVFAIHLQRKELQLQRRELELTRLELERTASAQEQASNLLSEQLGIMKSRQEMELRAQLVFRKRKSTGNTNTRKIYYEVHNLGATVVLVSFEAQDDRVEMQPSSNLTLSSDRHSEVIVTYPQALDKRAVPFYINTKDRRGRVLIQQFFLDPTTGSIDDKAPATSIDTLA